MTCFPLHGVVFTDVDNVESTTINEYVRAFSQKDQISHYKELTEYVLPLCCYSGEGKGGRGKGSMKSKLTDSLTSLPPS